MKIKVVVHEAEEGGYWAEVPAIPGCATQGETLEELMTNLHEAIEGCLSVDVREPESTGEGQSLGNRGMKALSGKDLARLLERKGWNLLRIRCVRDSRVVETVRELGQPIRQPKGRLVFAQETILVVMATTWMN